MNTTNMNATNTIEQFRVNAKGNFDEISEISGTSGRIKIGTVSDDGASKLQVGGDVSIKGKLSAVSTQEENLFSLKCFSNATIYNSNTVRFERTNASTVGSFGATTEGTIIGNVIFNGSNNTHFVDGAAISVVQSGPGNPTATNVPVDIVITTSPNFSTSPIERVRFTKDGSTKITNLAGTGNRAVYSDASGNLTNSSSDERVKKNIETINFEKDILETLKELRGVKYNWNTEVEGYEGMGEQTEIGVIAQEVEKVLPEIVGENATGYKSVDYAKMTAYLLEVNKALLSRIEALENK